MMKSHFDSIKTTVTAGHGFSLFAISHMKVGKFLSVLLMSIVLSSCGFQLRGSQALPETLDTVIINSTLQFSPMARALGERLPVYQLKGIPARSDEAKQAVVPATVLINLSPESLERRLLSVFSSGQVAEYELIYSVRYQVIFPNAQPISNNMAVSREYQDDPQQILAKSRELELVMNEMRLETADRIIRLLSSQYKLAVATNENN
jgi:LPS-assembly lipoprotein